MIIPQFTVPEPHTIINPTSLESIGALLSNCGFNTSSVASGTFVQNTIIYIPFLITVPIVALQMAVLNGATVNGVTHVGIYTEDGTRIVMASDTQTPTNTLQLFDISDTFLATGTYYMALVTTSATATFLRIATGAAALSRMLGCHQQALAPPLPAIATFASFAQVQIPMFGIVFVSVV